MKYRLLNWMAPLLAALGCILASCHKDEPVPDPPIPEPTTAKATILVYAVASNNLYSNLISDMYEMEEAMKYVDMSKYNLLVFSSVPDYYEDHDQELMLVVDNGAGPEFKTIASWQSNTETEEGGDHVFATDPRRIREVIDCMTQMCPAERYGMVFWSHGSSWAPGAIKHPEVTQEEMPEFYSFGQDVFGTASDMTNIDELALAIPDHLLDFVWFDACYMANIETMYELRNKCNYYIAYPSEIYSDGVPYHQVLPYLFKDTPDYVGAAKVTFNYYNDYQQAVTIGVFDMAQIDQLAEIARVINSEYNVEKYITDSELMLYSRGYIGKFYDLGTTTRVMAMRSEMEDKIPAFQEALDKLTLYHACSALNFNNMWWDSENATCINTHKADSGTVEEENFYRKLGWYKAVFAK